MTTGIQTVWATVDQIADLKAEYKLLHQQQLQHQQQKQEIIQEQLRQQQPEMIRMIVSQQASQPQKMTATSSGLSSQDHFIPGQHCGHAAPAHQTETSSTPSTLPGLMSKLDSFYYSQQQQIQNQGVHIPTLNPGIQNPRVFVTPQTPGVQGTPVDNGLSSHKLRPRHPISCPAAQHQPLDS